VNKRKMLLIAGVIFVIVTVLIILFGGRNNTGASIKVGFIMSGKTTDAGWNGMHYNGIKKACDNLNAELIVKEEVEEYSGMCAQAIEELHEESVKVIILSSYNYSEEVKDLVREYPEISFYCNSSEYHDNNMTSYFVRYYQGRYLAGVLAGTMTKNGKIGYVAAMDNLEVKRGINAFTLGVQSVNKDAEIVVAWSGKWEDETTEKSLVRELVEKEKVDILSYHQNKPYVIEEADAMGVYTIGYHEVFDGFSDKYLGSVVCDWQVVYQEIIKECLQGRSNMANNFWIGMEKDVVMLSGYSDAVSEDAKETVKEARESIIAGKEVFSGKIFDNEGNIRCKDDEMLSDDVLLEQMDWFVKGVRMYE